MHARPLRRPQPMGKLDLYIKKACLCTNVTSRFWATSVHDDVSICTNLYSIISKKYAYHHLFREKPLRTGPFIDTKMNSIWIQLKPLKMKWCLFLYFPVFFASKLFSVIHSLGSTILQTCPMLSKSHETSSYLNVIKNYQFIHWFYGFNRFLKGKVGSK